MFLTRYLTEAGPRWALDGKYLPLSFNLGLLLEIPAKHINDVLQNLVSEQKAAGSLLSPIEPGMEIWASGVTYLRSRDARVAEAQVSDIYERVYLADRPELFFKSTGTRAAGHGGSIRIRGDSSWNVPEPELVIIVNSSREIIGYCAGNDVSSRSIEAENPLYLPQAKIYDGSCAIGPGIQLCGLDQIRGLQVSLAISRSDETIFEGKTSIHQMKRSLDELVQYLFREQKFPQGVYLMTGTGIVPPDEFTLQEGDRVEIRVGDLTLENTLKD